MKALEEAHSALAETVEARAKHLTELERKVEALEEGARRQGKADVVGDDDDGPKSVSVGIWIRVHGVRDHIKTGALSPECQL